jgi:O-antigen/teichoic acid export membrane protein
MTKQSFLRHAAVYGLANLLVQAGAFVLVPLCTRCLSPEDFGAMEVLGRVAELVGACLLIGGLRQGLITFHQQCHGPMQRRRAVCAALSLTLGFCLLGGVILAFSPLASRFLGCSLDGGVLQLAILAVLLEPLALMPLALIQARVESVTFLSVTITQFLSRIALSVLFVAGFGWGAAGYFGATVLNGLCFGLFLSGRELLRGVVWPGWRRMGAMIAFALPFLPSALCFFVLQHGDRFFLLHYGGAREVAVYSLGYKLAGVVSAFTLMPLYMVWGSHLYAAARGPAAPQIFGRVFTRVLAIYLFGALGVALLEGEAVAILGGPAYRAAAVIVAPVLLGGLCQSAASLMDSAFYIRRRTGLKLSITLVVTAVMLALYAWLIPLYGALGAAAATFGGFLALALGTYFVTQQIFPVSYEWARLLALLGSAVGVWLLGRLLPEEAWATPARGGLWLLWPGLLWIGGVIRREEKQKVLALTRRCFAVVGSSPVPQEIGVDRTATAA